MNSLGIKLTKRRCKIINWRIALFKVINRGTDKIPRRLQFAQNLPFCRSKKLGVWIDLGAGIGHYLNFMPESSYGLDLNELQGKKISLEL